MSPLAATLQNMWKQIVKSSFVGLTAFALVGCSSGLGASDIKDGIEWHVTTWAIFDDDIAVDRYTGELYRIVNTSTGLSKTEDLPDKDSPAVRAAIADSKESFCDRYIDPWGEDPLESQGRQVEFVLRGTVNAAVANLYTDELLAAFDDQYNFPEGMTIDEYWEENYSHLTKLRDTVINTRQELQAEAFTPEFVLQAQKEIISYCDITVPENYEYPTMEQLDFSPWHLNSEQSETDTE